MLHQAGSRGLDRQQTVENLLAKLITTASLCDWLFLYGELVQWLEVYRAHHSSARHCLMTKHSSVAFQEY